MTIIIIITIRRRRRRRNDNNNNNNNKKKKKEEEEEEEEERRRRRRKKNSIIICSDRVMQNKSKMVCHNLMFSRTLLSFYTKNSLYFIPSSESSAYLKQIKCILSAVKKYRIFSLVTDTIFIFSL